ncbi:MAG: DUF4270 family protein [Bacteroidia bacterium]
MLKVLTNCTQPLLLNISTLKKHSFSWLFAFGATAMLFLQGCNQFNSTGKDVLPEDELLNIGVIDTLTFDIETQRLDSVDTDEQTTFTHIFGNMIDPEFGQFSAGIFTQFRYSGSELNFGGTAGTDTLQADSIVLILDFIGKYGRQESPQRMKVQEITQPFLKDSTYRSNDALAVNTNQELSSKKSLDFAITGYPDVLRVKLDKNLAEKILFAPNDSLKTNDAFTNYFKGLYISTYPVSFLSREPGAMYYVGLSSSASETKLRLYYSSKSGKTKKTQDFFVTNTTRQFHNIQRSDFENRMFGQALTNKNGQYHFVQSGALTQMLVKFPHLKKLGRIGINKAELIFKTDPKFLGAKIGSDYRYAPPILEVFRADSSGQIIDDDVLTLDRPSFNVSDSSYRIILNNHFQRIVSGISENNGIIIRPSRNGDDVNSSALIANSLRRVILGGKNCPEPVLRPKLRIIYTKLPE